MSTTTQQSNTNEQTTSKSSEIQSAKNPVAGQDPIPPRGWLKKQGLNSLGPNC